MARKPDLAAARAFHSELAAALKKVPPYVYVGKLRSAEDLGLELDYEEKRQLALAALRDLIKGNGGKIREGWDDTRIRVCGLRASSTSGLVNACKNWIRQLTLKSMAENMDGGGQ